MQIDSIQAKLFTQGQKKQNVHNVVYCFHLFIFKPRRNSHFALIMMEVTSKRRTTLVLLLCSAVYYVEPVDDFKMPWKLKPVAR